MGCIKLLSILCSLSCIVCNGRAVGAGKGGVKPSMCAVRNGDFLIEYDNLLSKYKDETINSDSSLGCACIGRLSDIDEKFFENIGVVAHCPDSIGWFCSVNYDLDDFVYKKCRGAFNALNALTNSFKDSERYDYYIKKVNGIINKFDKLAQENADTYNSQKNRVWLYSVSHLLLMVLCGIAIFSRQLFLAPAPLIAIFVQLKLANLVSLPAERAACYRGIALFLKEALESAKRSVEYSAGSKTQSEQVTSNVKIKKKNV